MVREIKSRKMLSAKKIKFYKELYRGLFVGISDDKEAVYLRFDSDDKDFSISGTGISIFGQDYDTLYESEKESLLDSYGVDTEEELEEAEASGSVAIMRDDKAAIDEMVSDSIGGGDYIEFEDLYYSINTAGQMQDSLVNMYKYAIDPAKIKRLWEIWDKYQLKPLKEVPKSDLEFVRNLFKGASSWY
jgi:hypothetical protein